MILRLFYSHFFTYLLNNYSFAEVPPVPEGEKKLGKLQFFSFFGRLNV